MSGFGRELDLSGILDDYSRWFKEPEPEPEREPEPPGPKYQFPIVLGVSRTTAFSTCLDLAVPIVIVWDTNGYYKALGVSPYATRRELMQGYMEKDGQSSTYLTYVFKQLLNPETRKAYDATPLGERFLDEYEQENLRRSAARTAMERSKAGRAVTGQDILDEWGFELRSDECEPDAPRTPRKRPGWARVLQYGYYAWLTSEYIQNEEKLSEWQSILVSEAAQMGIITRIAIGVTSQYEEAGYHVVRDLDIASDPIFYLNEQAEITSELAHKALLSYYAKK